MPAREDTTFDWGEGRFSLAFPGFLIFSLFVHLLGFYLFQVVYPPLSGAALRPPARITLLDPANPAHAPILGWVAAEDPARAARIDSAEPPGLLDIRYVPSYDVAGTQPLAPGPAQEMPAFPQVATPGGLLTDLMSGAASPPPQLAAAPTRIQFSASLLDRAPRDAVQGRKWDAVKADDLSPTRFLVGVTGEGKPGFIFAQSGSGSERLDRQARELLRNLRFDGDPRANVAWGNVSFFWGADVTKDGER